MGAALAVDSSADSSRDVSTCCTPKPVVGGGGATYQSGKKPHTYLLSEAPPPLLYPLQTDKPEPEEAAPIELIEPPVVPKDETPSRRGSSRTPIIHRRELSNFSRSASASAECSANSSPAFLSIRSLLSAIPAPAVDSIPIVWCPACDPCRVVTQGTAHTKYGGAKCLA